MNKWTIVVAFVIVSAVAHGTGESEAAASSAGRGIYLAGKGVIVPPAEVHIDSYIAAVDYLYPDPDGDFGITLYSGHRQVSVEY